MTTRAELTASLKPHPGYVWSIDYDLLLRLIEDGCLHGVVLYYTCSDGEKLFDPCRIKKYGMVGGYGVSARGIGYFDADTPDEMKALCAKYEVQFLVPQAPAPVVTKAQVEVMARTVKGVAGFHVAHMLKAAGIAVEE